MDAASVFAISAAGMAVERTRVEVAAMNLAHANTVQESGGPAYRPLRVVPQAGALPFTRAVDEGLAALSQPVVSVEDAAAAPRKVHDPGHPFADGQGYVAYPGVDTATEMVTLMSAMRAYEANVAALNTARTLALKTLEIGRGA